MTENKSYITDEEISIVQNQILKVLIPFSSFFINSRIDLRWDDNLETSISVKVIKEGEIAHKLNPCININAGSIISAFQIDIKKHRENNDLNALKKDLSFISLCFCHEFFHWFLGDVFLTQKQADFIASKDTFLDIQQKQKILNIYQDAIVNELINDYISYTNLNDDYWHVLEQFNNKIVRYHNYLSFIFSDVNDFVRNQFSPIQKVLTDDNNSWQALILTEKILQKFYKKIKINININLLGNDVFYINPDKNNGDFNAKFENFINNFLLSRETIKNHLKILKYSNDSIYYNRIIDIIGRSKKERIFQNILKLIKLINIIGKDKLSDEDPDKILVKNYNPNPKVCYQIINGNYIKQEYYDFMRFPTTKTEIMLYIDDSSSISEEDLVDTLKGARFIESRYPNIRFRVFVWSTNVVEIEENLTDTTTLNIQSAGGTDFKCVIDHICEMKYPPKTFIVVITDGCFKFFNLPVSEFLSKLIYKFILVQENYQAENWIKNTFNLSLNDGIYHCNGNYFY